MVDYVLLGEQAGRAVQATLLYPAKMLDDYWHSAKPILDNLQFKPN